jgi:hypothetical protein
MGQRPEREETRNEAKRDDARDATRHEAATAGA